MIRISSNDVGACVAPWMAEARWFRGATVESMRFVASCALPPSQPGAVTVLHLVECGSLMFSVPLTYYVGGVAENAIGVVAGSVAVVDATDDPVGQHDLYRLFYGVSEPDVEPAVWIDDAGAELDLTMVPARSIRDLPAPASSHKLTSEQSNTSIIYRYDHLPENQPAGIICKLLRVIDRGHNPDVELQQALDSAGSCSVPRQYGSVNGTWDDGSSADLIVAQEFLAGSVDAWQVITNELATFGPTMSSGQRERIVALGRLTRDIHDQLSTACGTSVMSNHTVVEHLKERAERAIADAPQLAEYRTDITELYDSVRDLAWPRAQRIHGDFHLGQVLDVPERGWVALDFEGEPLRPLSQRTQPDIALRDVAGMLRSFDYAAGTAEKAGADHDACRSWERAASAAYLEGYGHLTAAETHLLNAFVLDKALYEVSYETVSRPTWVDIPLAGVKTALLRKTRTT